jgi:hypothetical protein
MTTTTRPVTEAVSTLNSLLRGELSAVDTYDLAIDKADDSTGNHHRLETIRADHSDHIRFLQRAITTLGGEHSPGPGAWGAYATVVEATASLFGDAASLKALKEGEEHGLKEYREALEVPELPADVRTTIAQQMIPAQQRHIESLDSLIAAAGK